MIPASFAPLILIFVILVSFPLGVSIWKIYRLYKRKARADSLTITRWPQNPTSPNFLEAQSINLRDYPYESSFQPYEPSTRVKLPSACLPPSPWSSSSDPKDNGRRLKRPKIKVKIPVWVKLTADKLVNKLKAAQPRVESFIAPDNSIEHWSELHKALAPPPYTPHSFVDIPLRPSTLSQHNQLRTTVATIEDPPPPSPKHHILAAFVMAYPHLKSSYRRHKRKEYNKALAEHYRQQDVADRGKPCNAPQPQALQKGPLPRIQLANALPLANRYQASQPSAWLKGTANGPLQGHHQAARPPSPPSPLSLTEFDPVRLQQEHEEEAEANRRRAEEWLRSDEHACPRGVLLARDDAEARAATGAERESVIANRVATWEALCGSASARFVSAGLGERSMDGRKSSVRAKERCDEARGGAKHGNDKIEWIQQWLDQCGEGPSQWDAGIEPAALYDYDNEPARVSGGGAETYFPSYEGGAWTDWL